MIRRWVKEYDVAGSQSFPGNGKQDLTPKQKEIQVLKKALQECGNGEPDPKKGCRHLLQGRQQIFRSIKDHQAEFDVEMMCKVFEVTRSGFCALLKTKPSLLARNKEMISKEIEGIYHKSKGRYGSPT